MAKGIGLASKGKAIELSGVSKIWGDSVAVDDLSISVPAGSFTVLLGPSGCGKSTTLRMVAGLESVDRGHVTIGGRDVSQLPSAERDLAMVFQSYALFPHLTVGENIIFGLKVRRVARAERDARLRQVADLLGLSKLLERKPGQLSGGQQQRVALGRAIIAEKPVCLMDEPLSNLDAKLRHEMRVEIRALQQQLGFTMIYVTHDQVEAITMADQVVLLNGGKLEQAASPREIYERPASPFAARFIGTPPMNLLSPDVFGEAVANALSTKAGTCLIGIRPELLRVESDGALKARVTAAEYLGADVLADCRVGEDLLQVRLSGGDRIGPGDEIALGFSPSDLHIFETTSGSRRDDLLGALGSLLRP